MDEKVIEAEAGDSVESFSQRLIDLARLGRRSVLGKFNDVTIRVYPSHRAQVTTAFYDQRKNSQQL